MEVMNGELENKLFSFDNDDNKNNINFIWFKFYSLILKY